MKFWNLLHWNLKNEYKKMGEKNGKLIQIGQKSFIRLIFWWSIQSIILNGNRVSQKIGDKNSVVETHNTKIPNWGWKEEKC